MNLLEQIKQLHDSQLFDDVKFITSQVLSLSEHNPDMMTAPVKFQLMVYQGEAMLVSSEYKRAEAVFWRALQIKKMMNKAKGKTQTMDVTSEVDIKYKLYVCYMRLKQVSEAQNVLESISSKQRSSKINLALAQLYQKAGKDRSAVTAYKEVLRESPLSMQAAHGLLNLGVKLLEVEFLVKSIIPNMTGMDWFFLWLKGQALAATKEYVSATQTYKALDNKPLLRDNVEVLCSMGESQFLSGDYASALTTLQRAQSIDPLLLPKMDILAFLYFNEMKRKDLEALSTHMMEVSDTAPESWIAIGYYCALELKCARAVYFAQKALNIDPHNVNALLMKGYALREYKKTQDAIMHYREALRLAPHSFEAHKGLVDCYVAIRRTREATSCAGQACKQHTTARTLTLYASVLTIERLPFNLEKAKGYLEKALKMDSNYLEAVYVMSEIFYQQQQYDKGIEMLKNQLIRHSTSKLHTLLADFLFHTNDQLGASEHYSIALRLDPHNTTAIDGQERVEKHVNGGVNSSYDEVDDMEGSDNGADLEGSDIESAWSDIELN